jgi:hypothetical protein
MKTIHRFTLPVRDSFDLTMPTGAQFIKLDIQGHVATLWAIVDPQVVQVARKFRCFGTGQWIDDEALEYVGTVQAVGGTFAWHFFVQPETQQ